MTFPENTDEAWRKTIQVLGEVGKTLFINKIDATESLPFYIEALLKKENRDVLNCVVLAGITEIAKTILDTDPLSKDYRN